MGPTGQAVAGALIEVIASPRGERGEESFDVVVGTPQYLAEHGLTDDPFVQVVDRWDFPAIREWLTHAFETPEAPTRDQLGDILGRIGHWEFADYRPHVADDTPGGLSEG